LFARAIGRAMCFPGENGRRNRRGLEKTYIMNRIRRVLESLTIVKNKFEAICYLIGISSGKDITFFIEGDIALKVKGDRKNRTVFYTIHEIFKKCIYPVSVNQPQTIIDAGAQIGGFTVYALKRSPMSVVYSVEPDPDNYSYIIENIKINGYEKKAKPINRAIYSKTTSIQFNQNNDSTRAGSIFDKGHKQITVKTITLKDIFTEYNIDKCDVLKMDIEGAEYEAIYKCPQEILKKINKMFIECHAIDDKAENNIHGMKNYLRSNGFVITDEADSVITAINADQM